MHILETDDKLVWRCGSKHYIFVIVIASNAMFFFGKYAIEELQSNQKEYDETRTVINPNNQLPAVVFVVQ